MLTPKQEAFALEYIRNGKNASDAYRHAYDTENMSDKTINDEGYNLTIHPHIAPRIEEHHQYAIEYANITIESLVMDMKDCRDSSRKAEDRGNWRQSNVELAKMTGQYEDRTSIDAKITIDIRTDWE